MGHHEGEPDGALPHGGLFAHPWSDTSDHVRPGDPDGPVGGPKSHAAHGRSSRTVRAEVRLAIRYDL